jgi:hypothetical protein
LVIDDFILEMEASMDVDFTVNVITVSGQSLGEIYSGRLSKGQLFRKKFELNYASGIYFIQVQSTGSFVNFKLIKQ